MVRDFPLAVFIRVHVCVTGLDLAPVRSEGELVNTSIECPIVTLEHVAFENDTLWLQLQEIDKVGVNRVVACARSVRDSWKEDRLGRVAFGNSLGIESGEGIVPKREEVLDFLFGNGRDAGCLGSSEEGTSLDLRESLCRGGERVLSCWNR